MLLKLLDICVLEFAGNLLFGVPGKAILGGGILEEAAAHSGSSWGAECYCLLGCRTPGIHQ